MGCSSCKKKERFEEKYKEVTSHIGTATIVFVIIWTLLGVYGIYSLVSKLL